MSYEQHGPGRTPPPGIRFLVPGVLGSSDRSRGGRRTAGCRWTTYQWTDCCKVASTRKYFSIPATCTGTTAAIAEAGAGRYTFYWGTQELGPPPAAAATAPERPPAAVKPDGSQTEQLLKGLNECNGAILQTQGENLQKLYKRNKQGVQAMDAY